MTSAKKVLDKAAAQSPSLNKKITNSYSKIDITDFKMNKGGSNYKSQKNILSKSGDKSPVRLGNVA